MFNTNNIFWDSALEMDERVMELYRARDLGVYVGEEYYSICLKIREYEDRIDTFLKIAIDREAQGYLI